MSKITVAAAFALFAALSPCAVAQDKIVWTDGTTTADVKVTDFTWREVKYTARGQSEVRSADAVADLDVKRVADAYRRAFSAQNDDEAYTVFRREAEKLTPKDAFLAQFGFVNAAEMLVKNGESKQAFLLLEKMVEDLPDTGFYPSLYRVKLETYLSMGDEGMGNAAAVAKKYHDTALTQGWPDGFVLEAEFYQLLTSGETNESQLRTLLGKTEGKYPQVANRLRVRLADAKRAAGDLDSARQAYTDLLDRPGVDSGTRAHAQLGLGHTEFASGDPANTEPYREALLSFLRVYLEPANIASDMRAEALYHAALACDRWRGPDSGQYAARIRHYLHRDYPDSSWANR